MGIHFSLFAILCSFFLYEDSRVKGINYSRPLTLTVGESSMRTQITTQINCEGFLLVERNLEVL